MNCEINMVSSRMCEKGTKSCTVEHSARCRECGAYYLIDERLDSINCSEECSDAYVAYLNDEIKNTYYERKNPAQTY